MSKKNLFLILIGLAVLAFLYSWLTPPQQLYYKNADFGFSVNLPSSWKGFSIISNEKWNGLSTSENNEPVVTSGPMIIIRHPAWTTDVPRQDIPIMIFTLDQWNNLDKDLFHIGAAPIGPRELSRNTKYVFALPARYNYAFPAGYEEVDQVINSNPIKTF